MNSPRYSPSKRESVLQEALPPDNPPVNLIKGARIRFAPRQPTGLQRHPISTVGVVTEGSFIFNWRDKKRSCSGGPRAFLSQLEEPCYGSTTLLRAT